MLQEICRKPAENEPSTTEKIRIRAKGCRAFKILLAWQLKRYRRAVEENKWFMSENTGRDVGWKEAEYDFLVNEYYGCAPKWRMEFCASKCNHFSDCSLGQHFCLEE